MYFGEKTGRFMLPSGGNDDGASYTARLTCTERPGTPRRFKTVGAVRGVFSPPIRFWCKCRWGVYPFVQRVPDDLRAVYQRGGLWDVTLVGWGEMG